MTVRTLDFANDLLQVWQHHTPHKVRSIVILWAVDLGYTEKYCNTLYDNSTAAGHQILATIEGDAKVIYVPELPSWVAKANLNL